MLSLWGGVVEGPPLVQCPVHKLDGCPDLPVYALMLPQDPTKGQRHPLFLPMRPIWPGFAINSAIYGMSLFVLVSAWRALRREVRLARDACYDCGFPIGVSACCTECGADLNRVTSLTRAGARGLRIAGRFTSAFWSRERPFLRFHLVSLLVGVLLNVSVAARLLVTARPVQRKEGSLSNRPPLENLRGKPLFADRRRGCGR